MTTMQLRCVLPATLLSLVGWTASDVTDAHADNWPQFRGANAAGISREDISLPADIGPDRHLLWKAPTNKGHSSPVVFDKRIYLTALREQRLLTLAIDAESGKTIWEAEAHYETLEKVHRIGSPATPSVATDGEVVISFFGSSGLHAYGWDGSLRWKRPMGPFDNSFGAASSPVIVDDLVVIVQDHDTKSFLAAYDKQTGDEVWRVDRSEFRRNYSTPVIWDQDGVKQVVVAGTAQVNAYDVRTGEHLWVILRGSRVISATPVVGDDERLYVVNSGGGEAPNQPPFAELLATADRNGNRLMEQNELPASVIRSFLDQFDRDNDGSLNEAEYESIRSTMTYASPVAMAIDGGGNGDITGSHIAWSVKRSIPRNASPVVVGGLLYLIKDGGILTILEANSGRQVTTRRLLGGGKFFSSPVYGDGKIYVLSETGRLNVFQAERNGRQLSHVDLGEDVYATPAIAGGRIYIRTVNHLWCFGLMR